MLTLGGVLVVLLNGYYVRQERTHLTNSAQTMGLTMAQILEMDPPQSWVESQVRSFAFLSQARVRFLGPGSQVIADSGSLDSQAGVFIFEWDLSSVPATLSLTAHSAVGSLEWQLASIQRRARRLR